MSSFGRIRYRRHDGAVFLSGTSGTGFRVSNFEQIWQRLAL